MEKDVIISIKGTQKYEHNAPDVIELVTQGRLKEREGGYTLTYQESELTGLEGTRTTIEVEEEQVTLLREEALDGAFRAAAESVEEAILNSRCTADRVTATGMGAAGNETVTLAGFSEFLPALLPALRGRG